MYRYDEIIIWPLLFYTRTEWCLCYTSPFRRHKSLRVFSFILVHLQTIYVARMNQKTTGFQKNIENNVKTDIIQNCFKDQLTQYIIIEYFHFSLGEHKLLQSK